MKLTRARRRGLSLVAHGLARRSNVTQASVECSLVYWQTADWLVEQGLAVLGLGVSAEMLTLTDAGRHLARKEDLL